MHFDAEFYVALGFIILVLVLAYLGVHKRLTGALDDRARRVADELAQAKRLHDEAAAVLDSFKRKAAAAEAEAAAIVAQARKEAELMGQEAQARLTEFVARRTQQAEAKIAMAETQATADVRAAAADVAVRAAETVLRRDPRSTGVSDLAGREIARLKTQFH
jgi:F-type H+-transporting ATPase subunit b